MSSCTVSCVLLHTFSLFSRHNSMSFIFLSKSPSTVRNKIKKESIESAKYKKINAYEKQVKD